MTAAVATALAYWIDRVAQAGGYFLAAVLMVVLVRWWLDNDFNCARAYSESLAEVLYEKNWFPNLGRWWYEYSRRAMG